MAAVWALAGAMCDDSGGCAIQALQPQQVAAVVGDRDGHRPVVLERLGLGGGGNGLEVGQFEKGLGLHGLAGRVEQPASIALVHGGADQPAK